MGDSTKTRPLAVVVDDDPDFARLLERRLEAVMDIEVRDTAIGLSARMMTTPTPDLILLDCMMPALTGPAVLKLLQSNPRLKSIPVILMSASETFADAAEAHDRAVFIQKSGHLMPLVALARQLTGVDPTTDG
jgi:CheY-like chemotaxis protein